MTERVVITGANRGLGLVLARRYAERGERRVAGCRRPAEATRSLPAVTVMCWCSTSPRRRRSTASPVRSVPTPSTSSSTTPVSTPARWPACPRTSATCCATRRGDAARRTSASTPSDRCCWFAPLPSSCAAPPRPACPQHVVDRRLDGGRREHRARRGVRRVEGGPEHDHGEARRSPSRRHASRRRPPSRLAGHGARHGTWRPQADGAGERRDRRPRRSPHGRRVRLVPPPRRHRRPW